MRRVALREVRAAADEPILHKLDHRRMPPPGLSCGEKNQQQIHAAGKRNGGIIGQAERNQAGTAESQQPRPERVSGYEGQENVHFVKGG